MIEYSDPKNKLIIYLLSASLLLFAAAYFVGVTKKPKLELVGVQKDKYPEPQPDLSRMYSKKIFDLEFDGDIEAALELSNEYVEKFPDIALSYQSRAFIETVLGKKDAAMKDHKKALKFVLDDKDSTNTLIALSYFHTGDYDKVLEFANKEIASTNNVTTPAVAACRCAKARVFNKQGKYEKAVQECNKVMTALPYYPYAREYRGEANIHLGRYETAVSDLTSALKDGVYKNGRYDLANLYRLRSTAYEKLGKLELAKADYKSYEELSDYTKKRRDGYIGILFGGPGNIVQSVANNSPAKLAGIKVGDEIISIDGKSFGELGFRKFIRTVRGQADSEVKISYLRDGKEISVFLKRKAVKHSVNSISFSE